jgi:hypothetical protein
MSGRSEWRETERAQAPGTQPAHAWRFLQVPRVARLSLHALESPYLLCMPRPQASCQKKPMLQLSGTTGPDILLLRSDDLLMASQESERSSTHRDGSEDSLILIRRLTFIYRRFMLGNAARWVALECALSCTKLRDRVRSHNIGFIKNTLKTFRPSHDVCNVSVVSVTNKSTQQHFWVPDSVSRISCLTLPLIVCGGGARSAKP